MKTGTQRELKVPTPTFAFTIHYTNPTNNQQSINSLLPVPYTLPTFTFYHRTGVRLFECAALTGMMDFQDQGWRGLFRKPVYGQLMGQLKFNDTEVPAQTPKC
jgi:hypothetical protein